MDRWTGIRVSQILFAILLTGCFVAFSVAEEETTDVGTVIGIDLGTTYSCVGVYRNGRVEIIPNDQGNRITPSWTAFTDNEMLIGEAAKNQAALNPERTIFEVKRLIGRRFDDPEVQRHIKFLPYEIVNKDGKPYIQVKIRDGETKVFSPEEISAMILTKMKETAESFLGKTIKDAVVAVPAYFNDAQRQATRDAGTIAGLKVGIINELTAAVIAYSIDEKGDKKNILVFDLGGGTFDVGILRVDGRVFDVLATNGDAHLGGEDFDRRIMEHFIKLIKKRGKDISEDKEALGKMRRECERAKRALSNQHQVRVEIESLYDGLNFSKWLARARFEEFSGDLFKKTMGPVQKAMEDAGLEKHQIDEIVLVGGGSRIPKVQQLLKNYFDGKEPNMGVNPDVAVAYGAAILGTLLRGDFDKISGDILHLDLTPLGNEIINGSITKLIPRKTFIPTKESQDLTNAGLQTFNILIEFIEGEGSLIEIPPAPRSVLFEITFMNGTEIPLAHRVVQIEITIQDDTEIPPAPGGVSRIEVRIACDANGFLTLKVEDSHTGNTAKITITNDEVRLSSGKIRRTVEEAEKLAEKVKEIKEKIDARNQLETYVDNVKNTINDKDKLGDKLESKYKEEVEEAVKDALEWINGNPNAEKEDFDKKMEEFQATCDRIISAVYQGWRTWLLQLQP